MRPLVIDDNARAVVKRVVEYAETHHYKIGDPVAGDNPNFVAHLNTYRCVFTFTHADGIVWRHLTISVPSEKYPHYIAAFEIATLFGFTGWEIAMGEKYPTDWQAAVQKEHHCVVLVQPVKRLQEKTDA